MILAVNKVEDMSSMFLEKQVESSGNDSIISFAGSTWEKYVDIGGSIILLALVEVILLSRSLEVFGRSVLI